MEIRCHTNLDLHCSEKWPEELPARPMLGDLICSSTGLELSVVRVKFGYPVYDFSYQVERSKPKCMCYVELHLPPYRFNNVTEFENWYNKRS